MLKFQNKFSNFLVGILLCTTQFLQFSCKTANSTQLQNTSAIQDPATLPEGWWIYFSDGSFIQSSSILLTGRLLKVTPPNFPTLTHIEVSQLKAISKFPLNKQGDDAFLSRKEEGVYYRLDTNTKDNSFKNFDFLESVILTIQNDGLRLSEFEKPLPISKGEVLIFRNETSKNFGKIKAGDPLSNSWMKTISGELLYVSEITESDSQYKFKTLSQISSEPISTDKSQILKIHKAERGVIPLLSLNYDQVEITCDQKKITPDDLQFSLCNPRVLSSITDEYPDLKELKDIPALRLVSTTSLILKLGDKLPKGGEFQFKVQKTTELENGIVVLKLWDLNSNQLLLAHTFNDKSLNQPFKINLPPKAKLKIQIDDGEDGFIGDTLLIYDAKIFAKD